MSLVLAALLPLLSCSTPHTAASADGSFELVGLSLDQMEAVLLSSHASSSTKRAAMQRLRRSIAALAEHHHHSNDMQELPMGASAFSAVLKGVKQQTGDGAIIRFVSELPGGPRLSAHQLKEILTHMYYDSARQKLVETVACGVVDPQNIVIIRDVFYYSSHGKAALREFSIKAGECH